MDDLPSTAGTSLVELARRQALPTFQRMDQATLEWISQHRPDFGPQPRTPLPRLPRAVSSALRGAATLPQTWYAEPEIIDGIHGTRHAGRVAVYTAMLAASRDLDVDDQVALVIAAAIHDCRRHDDRGDEGHGGRAARWLGTNCYLVARHFQVRLPPLRLTAMRVAIALHDRPYGQFTGQDIEAREQAAFFVDTLKTADALDRYQQPRLKWWPNLRYLVLLPPMNLLRLAFELVCETERRWLATGDGTTSLLETFARQRLV